MEFSLKAKLATLGLVGASLASVQASGSRACTRVAKMSWILHLKDKTLRREAVTPENATACAEDLPKPVNSNVRVELRGAHGSLIFASDTFMNRLAYDGARSKQLAEPRLVAFVPVDPGAPTSALWLSVFEARTGTMLAEGRP